MYLSAQSPRAGKMRLSVIIPVFNEKATIGEIVKKVKKIPVEKEIIVVDDGSNDGTQEVLRTIDGIKLIRHKKNYGKGQAVRTGITHATGDIVIFQDADLEYEPMDYLKILAPILQGKAQVVYGTRFNPEGKFIRASYIANRILTSITNLLFNAHIQDMETCYKCMPLKILKSLNLKSNRFEIEPEITAKLLRLGYKITEVPIKYTGRPVKLKKIKLIDGIKAILTLLKYRLL